MGPKPPFSGLTFLILFPLCVCDKQVFFFFILISKSTC